MEIFVVEFSEISSDALIPRALKFKNSSGRIGTDELRMRDRLPNCAKLSAPPDLLKNISVKLVRLLAEKMSDNREMFCGLMDGRPVTLARRVVFKATVEFELVMAFAKRPPSAAASSSDIAEM